MQYDDASWCIDDNVTNSENVAVIGLSIGWYLPQETALVVIKAKTKEKNNKLEEEDERFSRFFNFLFDVLKNLI